MFGDTATTRIDRIIGKFQVMVDGLNKSIEQLKELKQKNVQEIEFLATDNEIHDRNINRAASVRDKLVAIIN